MFGNMGKIGVLILHGMGRQKAGYADGLIDDLKRRLGATNIDPEEVKFEAVLYAPVFEDIQRRRAPKMQRASHRWQIFSRLARKLLIFIFSDATSYRGTYVKVHKEVSMALGQLQNQIEDGAPIIVAAHSMGAIVISDYIYDRQQGIHQDSGFTGFKNLRALVTFGCNIPFFEMGHVETVPIDNPAAGKGPPDFVWTNLYSPFDILGYPIDDYYDKAPDFVIHDIRFYAGGVLTFWNWFSHNAYWKAGRVHKEIVDVIAGQRRSDP